MYIIDASAHFPQALKCTLIKEGISCPIKFDVNSLANAATVKFQGENCY